MQNGGVGGCESEMFTSARVHAVGEDNVPKPDKSYRPYKP